MRWRVYLCSVLFVFLGLFVCSVIINQNNVSAVSDISGTLDSSTPTYTCLCDNNNSSLPNCSDFSYFLLENTSLEISSSYYIMFDFSPIINGARLPYNSSLYISISSVSSIWFRNPTSFGSNTFSYTLTSSLGSLPSGSLSISQNGTYDVSSYAEAVVDVPAEVIEGDYHDDLVSINNSILICASVCLILYFFYCIYRMLLKGLI